MAFLKPTQLNIDDEPKVSYMNSFTDNSKLDRLSKKLIEYGFITFNGPSAFFTKNGIDFIYRGGVFKISNGFEQSTIKMKTVNLVNIKRVIKGMVDFTLIKT